MIDVFSKHAWIVPLKNKQGETVRKHFNASLKMVENLGFYGLIKAQRLITNM